MFSISLTTIILVGHTRPFYFRFDNILHLFNEMFILITCYHMICFSSFVDDAETINLIGYSLNVVLVTQIGLNILIIILRKLWEKFKTFKERKRQLKKIQKHIARN